MVSRSAPALATPPDRSRRHREIGEHRPLTAPIASAGAMTMQELTYTASNALEWREAPEPELSSDAAALVRPLAVATCDLDALIITGQSPFAPPFALGHECVAEVVDTGDAVSSLASGELVSVPFQISCGECEPCRRGRTGNCAEVGFMSTYGFGPAVERWGGFLSDLVCVPYAEHMLVPVPDGVAPAAVASASDTSRTPGALSRLPCPTSPVPPSWWWAARAPALSGSTPSDSGGHWAPSRCSTSMPTQGVAAPPRRSGRKRSPRCPRGSGRSRSPWTRAPTRRAWRWRCARPRPTASAPAARSISTRRPCRCWRCTPRA